MKKLVLLILSLMVGINMLGGINDLTLYTEIYPPYNYEEDGEAVGIGPDILVEVLEKLNSTLTRKDIQIVPWARGYRLAQMKPNTVIFTTTRTEQREELFKWVGPVVKSGNALIAKKSDNIKINSFKDLENYTIGTVLDDISEQILKDKGVIPKSLDSVPDPVFNIKKLDSGRIDLMAYGAISSFTLLKENGFDASKYEIVFPLEENPPELYFAFNPNTPDNVINQYQNALDELKADGTYQKILDKYLK